MFKGSMFKGSMFKGLMFKCSKFQEDKAFGIWILDLGSLNLGLCRPIAPRLVSPHKIRIWNFDLGIWALEFETWDLEFGSLTSSYIRHPNIYFPRL